MTCRTSNRRKDSHCYPITHVCKSYEAPYLRDARIATTHELLARAATPYARVKLAGQVGLKPDRIFAMVSAADLLRIHKVGTEHAAGLRAAGIFSVQAVKEYRYPKNLRNALLEARQFRFSPPLAFVRRWIEQARTLEQVITY